MHDGFCWSCDRQIVRLQSRVVPRRGAGCASPARVSTMNSCDECQRQIGDDDGALCGSCVDLLVALRGAEWWSGMTLHIYDDLEQGTEAWHAARRGLVTASVVGKLITSSPPNAITVGCPTCNAQPLSPCISASRKTPTPIKTLHDARLAVVADLPPVYTAADNDTSRAITATLAAERITGWTEDGPMTSDMWRGVELEPVARDEYAKHHSTVEQVGFMVRTEDDWTLGYSPDGLVGDDGLLEIKAPRGKAHVLAVVAGEVPHHNYAQLQAGLLVSGRAWIDFVPFVGGLPLWVKRVTPTPPGRTPSSPPVSRSRRTPRAWSTPTPKQLPDSPQPSGSTLR